MYKRQVYVWTHDSFRVGEDGPTHQPVEHEAQIRLMEHLRNHHDERSMLVLRPADGDETVMAWKLAVEEHRPVALVLSRQNIKTLPTLGAIRREEAAQVAKGGYVVMDAAKPAAVLIATGSEAVSYTHLRRADLRRRGQYHPGPAAVPRIGRSREGHSDLHQLARRVGFGRTGHLRHHAAGELRRGDHLHGACRLDGRRAAPVSYTHLKHHACKVQR